MYIFCPVSTFLNCSKCRAMHFSVLYDFFKIQSYLNMQVFLKLMFSEIAAKYEKKLYVKKI